MRAGHRRIGRHWYILKDVGGRLILAHHCKSRRDGNHTRAASWLKLGSGR